MRKRLREDPCILWILILLLILIGFVWNMDYETEKLEYEANLYYNQAWLCNEP